METQEHLVLVVIEEIMVKMELMEEMELPGYKVNQDHKESPVKRDNRDWMEKGDCLVKPEALAKMDGMVRMVMTGHQDKTETTVGMERMVLLDAMEKMDFLVRLVMMVIVE